MANTEKKYIQLYQTLRGEIIRGEWGFGARLPSRRQIALERGLSTITVDHCYELLCQEGYVETRPRSGYYVCYRSSDGFAAAQTPPHSPAPVCSAPAPQEAFPFSVLARAMRKVLSAAAGGLAVLEPDSGFCGFDVAVVAAAELHAAV